MIAFVENNKSMKEERLLGSVDAKLQSSIA
jgi:hypothetical protein